MGLRQHPGQMSAFLPPEWRGHVCAFIRLTPGQKITTGGRAPSGAPKTCPVSKDSGAGPVTVRPSVCVEAAQPYTGSGRPGEKVRENGMSRELGDVPCPQGPERPRPRVWSASEVAQASVASSGCPLWPAEPAAEPSPLPPGANIWSGRPRRQWGGCRHCPRMRRETRGTAPGSGENLAAAPRRVGRGKSRHLRRSPVPPPKTAPPASPSPRACVTVWQKRPCPSPVPLWSASPRQGSQGPHGPRR